MDLDYIVALAGRLDFDEKPSDERGDRVHRARHRQDGGRGQTGIRHQRAHAFAHCPDLFDLGQVREFAQGKFHEYLVKSADQSLV
jgi:hypothetical protein